MGSQFLQACWFYVINRASFSGATQSGGMGDGDRFTASQIDKLAGYRFPANIEIHRADSLDRLRRNQPERRAPFLAEDAFIFLDPPYDLKKGSVLYGNGGDLHKGFDHKRLRDLLDKLHNEGARWMVTYNEDERIRDLYHGYRFVPATWKYGMSNNKNGKELFIFNYN